jgi:Uma2 family endonuclease
MAHEARPSTVLTLEQFERIPDSTRYKLELSRGLVVREPRPGARHGVITSRIHNLLFDSGERSGHGLVVTQCGFLLAEDPATVREPDVAFITPEHHTNTVPDGFWPFAPDLAVEVISPSNTVSYISQKVVEYLEAGCRLVWVVDPPSRTVWVHRSLNDGRILRENDELTGEPVIPGLRASVAALFAAWQLP